MSRSEFKILIDIGGKQRKMLQDMVVFFCLEAEEKHFAFQNILSVRLMGKMDSNLSQN